MTDRMLRRPEVESLTGPSKSTLYRMIARGDLPVPARIGERAVGWYSRTVQDWLALRHETEML
ncbi:Prophage CP4-57 regulatory protein (AlpA) [Roseivivax jejudonensis]|uniref:Prophage CP4-57 regulatory protein (AlpA) n=2 Tax=Roseivivax jejudonensis TaxID=1529041 RepID=A0A1X7A6Q9_9RHOB|nr:Prophage CP4-57 regulatory protein (AlpA) [Roseivivax jejudonensis]